MMLVDFPNKSSAGICTEYVDFRTGVQNVANPVVLVLFLCGKNQVVKTVWKFLGGISQNDLPGFSNHGWKMFPCFCGWFSHHLWWCPCSEGDFFAMLDESFCVVGSERIILLIQFPCLLHHLHSDSHACSNFWDHSSNWIFTKWCPQLMCMVFFSNNLNYRDSEIAAISAQAQHWSYFETKQLSVT